MKYSNENTMHEILICIHDNRFLMNRIKIKLLIQNPALSEEIWIFT